MAGVESRSRLGVRSDCQKAPHGDVLINVLPVDSDSQANETPVGALRGRGAQEPGKPFERSRNATGVSQCDDDFVVREGDVYGIRNWFTGQSAHPRQR